MLSRYLNAGAVLCLFMITTFIACQKNLSKEKMGADPYEKNDKAMGLAAKKGTEFYALTASNELVHFISGNPLIEKGSMPITGLQTGEHMLAIDFRPATGQLYGVSSNSIIYVINLNSGIATAAGPSFMPAIDGDQVGLDFNPTVDRIRLVTNKGQDLRLNPETGAVVAIDGNISIPSASVTSVAYSNSYAGTTSTTLYDIDVAADKLYVQNPPNAGILVKVGSLGVQAMGESGFDIAPDNSVALAALYGRGDDGGEEASAGNQYRFYYIDLKTGKATNAGKTSRQITGLAIPTWPVAYAVDDMNRLMIINPATGSIITKNITGLATGEDIVGIDMRPATAQLYALGSGSRIYAINMSNGAALQKGTMPFSPMLTGNSYGFDFNPTVDRMRVLSNAGQNLRVHPETGMVVAIDPDLNPGMPNIDACAYTNSFAGTTTTMLYDVDVTEDMLYLQNPANAGTLVNGKALGIKVEAGNGFDIGGSSNKAWGIFTVGGKNGLYNIDLSSGKASWIMSLDFAAKGFAVGLGF